MDDQRDVIDIFLQPGEYFVGDDTYRVHTLLGSCVSITLWHPVRRVGAMSHFLVAERNEGRQGRLDGRYGVEVMKLMLRELVRANIDPAQCQGKIFGGGNMFPQQISSKTQNIGKKNGEAARSLLHANGISIVSESLFGIGHRRIVFDIRTGDVWVRQTDERDRRERP